MRLIANLPDPVKARLRLAYCRLDSAVFFFKQKTAYEMNPTTNDYQSILITASSNKADLNLLLEASEDYMLRRHEAEAIVNEVVAALKPWKSLATKLGISEREIALFAGRLPS